MLGFVSLCSDMTYQGARSITGPYLGSFGVSAMVVTFIAGFGELIAYGVRIFSGFASDKTGRYWLITLMGYGLNLLSVPLLALAGRWEIAAVLLIIERFGKGLRNPPRDAMLSYATKQVGRGWGFGIHEAMDQFGAVLGPVALALVLSMKGGYRTGFAVLAVPAAVAIGLLLNARRLYPSPRDMEPVAMLRGKEPYPRIYWVYLAAAALIAAGYADYPLIAYHFGRNHVVISQWIPLLYALAMGVDALSAIFFGRLYDSHGLKVLIVAAILSAGFAPLVFLGGFSSAIAGMVLWGIGMGAQGSVMRAAIASMTHAGKRGSAFGLFNTVYGVFWFLGSVFMGFLYGKSMISLVAFSIGAQLLAVPLLIAISRQPASAARAHSRA